MSIFELIYVVVLLVIMISVLISFHAERKAKVVPAPTLRHVRNRALSLIPDTFDRNGSYKIIDLGSGWGGVLIALSNLFPNSEIVGYEISPCPFILSKIRGWIRSKNIKVYSTNFLNENISDADIIFCYLSPNHMKQLAPLFSTLGAGKSIISCAFPLPGWAADSEDRVSGYFCNTSIYCYKTSGPKP